MPEQTDPYFFVIGADRSGTTMLRLMLNEHPEISVGPETWFFLPLCERFGIDRRLDAEELDEAIRIVLEHERFGEYPVAEEEFRSRVAQLDRPTTARLYAELLRILAEREGAPLFGDKTPGYSHCALELARAFPQAKFIHIVRDARDVSLSLVRVGWYGGKPWRTAQHWLRRVDDAERALAVLGPKRALRINYKDLVLQTEATLHSLCRFLEIEYDPAMSRFYEDSQQHLLESEQEFHSKTMRAPSPSDVDVWKRQADRWLLLYVEGGAGRRMSRLGQELSLKGIWRICAKLAWWMAMIRMLLLYPIRRGLIVLLRGDQRTRRASIRGASS